MATLMQRSPRASHRLTAQVDLSRHYDLIVVGFLGLQERSVILVDRKRIRSPESPGLVLQRDVIGYRGTLLYNHGYVMKIVPEDGPEGSDAGSD